MKRQQPSLDGRVLIIDDDDLFRAAMAKQLERAGCAASTVESYEQGLTVFAQDPEIKVVLVDHPVGGGDVAPLITALRRIRPQACIVGNRGADREAEFAAAGVPLFLHKPWRPDDLFKLVPHKIGICVECGLPLPLVHPGSQGGGESWACAFCGSRYYALLDEDAPPEIRAHAVRVPTDEHRSPGLPFIP